MMKIKNATKQGYIEAEIGDGVDISGRMQYHRGTVQKGISQTLTTAGGNGVGVVTMGGVMDQCRIRRLTPCECIKLMGFEKEDFDAMKKLGLSDAAIYHVAGDSIVVTVLMSIFSNFVNDNDTHKPIIENYMENLINDGKINSISKGE